MDSFIIVFKADGDDLNLSTRHIGPFASWDAAYDALGRLPAPVNGGHKFIQQLEAPARVDAGNPFSPLGRANEERRLRAETRDVSRAALAEIIANLRRRAANGSAKPAREMANALIRSLFEDPEAGWLRVCLSLAIERPDDCVEVLNGSL